MGSRVGTGVSPGESRARTGAAVGPGSISGLSRNVANEVLSRAERLRGNNLTPEKVQMAYESFRGLPDRSGPGMKMFAIPPSEAIKKKNIRPDAIDLFLNFQENLNKPPSMSIPQLPNNPFPGYEFSPNLPDEPPSRTIPEEVPLPNTPLPGTPGASPEFFEEKLRPMPFLNTPPPEFFEQRLRPMPFQVSPPPEFFEGRIIPPPEFFEENYKQERRTLEPPPPSIRGIGSLIVQDLIDKGLLDGE